MYGGGKLYSAYASSKLSEFIPCAIHAMHPRICEAYDSVLCHDVRLVGIPSSIYQMCQNWWTPNWYVMCRARLKKIASKKLEQD